MDIVLHFMLYLFFVGLMLSFVGFWQFGAYDPNYSTIPQTMRTFTSMFFNGGMEIPDNISPIIETLFVFYRLRYGLSFIVIFLNVLIAIMDADAFVKRAIIDFEAENNVLCDIYDLALTYVECRYHRWLNQHEVLIYVLIEENHFESRAVARGYR